MIWDDYTPQDEEAAAILAQVQARRHLRQLSPDRALTTRASCEEWGCQECRMFVQAVKSLESVNLDSD
jgi:hypothetical protein